jgi:ubiquinone/menaquinone biosynthesis C-methylase UbiE
MAPVPNNYDVFDKENIVKRYAMMTGLHPCEIYSFEQYITAGQDIIDIGVGAGRTTEYLAKKANRYLGIDISPNMIESCRNRYPGVQFEVDDATLLHKAPTASFDVAVFSFNGISSIQSNEGRAKCLKSVSRVLKPGGIFIFSISNAKFIAFLPVLHGVGIHKKIWRILLSIGKSLVLMKHRILSGVFISGNGYNYTSAEGGLELYAATPEVMENEYKSLFNTVEIVNYNLQKTPKFFVGSHCYILSKR